MAKLKGRNIFTTSILLALLTGALAVPATADPTAWAADAAHTEINFSVKHFFTPVTGSFSDFDVELNYDPDDLKASTVEARIKVASIDTGNERRDSHLRSDDWFEADKYPYITFKSSSVTKKGKNGLIARGTLTIKGESKEVELPITLLGKQAIPEQMQEMLGGTKEVASFQATTAVDRGDFGVGVGNWAATMVVGGEVSIEILLEAHRK